MNLLNHMDSGAAGRPIVFVHGFGCALNDWDAQAAHFGPRHRVIAVDLRAHGATPDEAQECSIERYGADVAALTRALDLAPAVVVGHSMGCRVVTEAALQAPERVAGVVLVDGSQFAPAMEPTIRARFAEPDGYHTMVDGMFAAMFNAKSDPIVAKRTRQRALSLAQAVGETMLLDMLRYDVLRFTSALAGLPVPVMAIQTTYANEKRERRSLAVGQTSPYLDMLRAAIPGVRVEVIPDTGHFPQLDEPDQTNRLIAEFVASIR